MRGQTSFKKVAESKGFEVVETSRKIVLDDNVTIHKIDKYKIRLIGDMILIKQDDFLQILKDSKTLAG